MKMTDTLNAAYRYGKNRLAESVLVIMGTGLGVGILTSLLSLVTYYSQDLLDFSDIYYRQIDVRAGIEKNDPRLPVTLVGRVEGNSARFSLKDIAAVKEACPDVLFGYLEENYYQTVDSGGEGSILPLSGKDKEFPCTYVTSDYFGVHEINARVGTLFTERDVEEESKLVVLGGNFADREFPDYSSESLIGVKISLKNIAYTVIGIMEWYDDPWDPKAQKVWNRNNRLYFPYTAYPEYSGNDVITDALHFITPSIDSIPEAAQQISLFFGMEKDQALFVVTDNREAIEGTQKKLGPLILSVLGLSLSVLVIAFINIFNMMVARVAKRVKSMALLKALGASRRDLARLVLAETLLMGVGGGLFGSILSFPFARIIQAILLRANSGRGNTLDYRIGFPALAASFAGVLLILFLIGLYPAAKASGDDTVTALHQL